MGNNLFGADIAGVINTAIGPGVLAGTLTHIVKGTRDSNNLTGGHTQIPSIHTFRGFYDDDELNRLPNTLVQVGDRAALIIGDSITPAVVPETNDEVTLEGKTGKIVRMIERDPDAATYLVQVRASS